MNSKLEQMYAEATALPWAVGHHEPDMRKRKANEQLQVHAVNTLPALIEALKMCLRVIEGEADDTAEEVSRRTREILNMSEIPQYPARENTVLQWLRKV